MELTDDHSIVEAVLNGNKQAYAQIVRRYQNKLYGLFRKMGASEADAQDLPQETLLKAYSKLATHNPERSFAGWWIYTIAVNLQKDRGSRQKTNLVQEDSYECETPESKLLQKELRSEPDRLLEALPEHYRLVLILRYTNQLSHNEIADMTGMSVRQVTNAVFRAKNSLRKIVEAKEGKCYDILAYRNEKASRKAQSVKPTMEDRNWENALFAERLPDEFTDRVMLALEEIEIEPHNTSIAAQIKRSLTARRSSRLKAWVAAAAVVLLVGSTLLYTQPILAGMVRSLFAKDGYVDNGMKNVQESGWCRFRASAP